MLNEYKQDSLRDLIAKSRGSKNIPSLMNKVLNDIKKELYSNDKNVKVHALLKLIFLYLNHNDIKWASFNTLEILATCGLQGKRAGNLMGQIQFKQNPECLQLIPNLIRKDLQSMNNTYISNSLNLVNNIMNINLAFDITKDLEKLLNVNNNLIRKKLIISLVKSSDCFLKQDKNNQFWDELLLKLITLLNKDVTNGVAICVISSIQKICKNYPDKCLNALPVLMDYFTNCTINWCLIKIVDIFAMFFHHLPKLTKKVKIINIIAQKLAGTTSKSVEMQLVKLVITNLEKADENNVTAELFKNCEERLRNLLFFPDPNLVMISLRILKELFHKNRLISVDYLTDIMKILDGSSNKYIQAECLEIINLSVAKENYKKIIEHLFELIDKLGTKAIMTILDICTYNSYSRLETKENFSWFINILFTLAEREFGKETELKIAYIMRDIAQRIETLRELIADKSYTLIKTLIKRTNELFNEENQKRRICFIGESNFFIDVVKIKNPDTLITVLSFIIGEYTQENETVLNERVDFLLDIFEIKSVKENYYIAITNSLVKLLLRLSALKGDINKDILERMSKAIEDCDNFIELEIIEMNVFIKNIISFMRSNNREGLKKISSAFFEVKLLPLHEKAQTLVPFPKDFDITMCFPLNDDELNVSSGVKKVEIENENIRSENQIEEKLTIDKNLYTPNI